MRDDRHDDIVKKLYIENEYLAKNPSLHEEDSPWKVSKILPLIDNCMPEIDKDEMNLLDVGGGAGLILSAVSDYIEKNYCIRINKYMLDLSSSMLAVQKEKNPEYIKALNEDIRETSLGDKEIDLALIIDVLEHVPNPSEALREIRRISKLAIFKVPLEDTLLLRSWNWVMRGKPRHALIENFGHINTYGVRKLKCQIEKHAGSVQCYFFTDVFSYFSKSDYFWSKMSTKGRSVNLMGAYAHKISPRICSFIFPDYVMIMVKCY